MIVCSLTPRTFKLMDIEAILRSARAGIPIQACSLPGAGGTSPVTLPGTVLLASAEIIAMVAMAATSLVLSAILLRVTPVPFGQDRAVASG